MSVSTGSAKLYTPSILSLAVELARYPMRTSLDLHGEAKSSTCGSTLEVGLACNPLGAIEELGLRVSACAIGQASAAIFARHAKGRSRTDISQALDELSMWLADGGKAPDWPDLSQLAAAQGYPARHGAILLPWKAAQQALSNSHLAR